MKRTSAFSAAALVLFSAPQASALDRIEFDPYVSLRLQAEAVDPDGADSYTGFRDAYSRIGFRASAPLADAVDAFVQLELPLDLANGRVQDPFDNDQDVRIAKVGFNTGLGTFAYGQDWMPYYNAIAYPVDMFSSYYSGFATFTSFRLGDSFYYYSPDLNGFSFGASYSRKRGYTRTDGTADDRYQFTASYRFGDTTISAGLDDVGGSESWRFYGLSLMHTVGNFYLGAKIEWIDSRQKTAGFGRDGDIAANLFGSYTLGKNVFKGMIAQVDGFGDTVFHAGVDHNWSDRLTLFAEFYTEQEGAAIPTRRARDSAPLDAFGTGGNALALGAHLSF